MELSPLRQLRKGLLPKMVSWYDPRLLARIGVRTVISSVFGQYADQRLIQAVTDPAQDNELVARYDYRDPNAAEPHKRISIDENGAFWIDYAADVGDGFESTYNLAYLLAQDSLDIRGPGRLRHGDILILGGDQCYPQATREEYKKRLLQPFGWAFTVANPQRKLFAIPGNHDWYDGLVAFDSLFCSSRDKLSNEKGNIIGGWQCHQHRSYWALRLPHNWWIWGADIQFSKYLDVSQVNYFERVAEQMGPKDHLVICLAEPSWMLAELQGQDEEENFFKITTIARRRGARIVAVIAGDWHHYSRYYAHELDIHFVTSGGAGAFLHPTHVLRNSISVRWPERPEDADAPDVDTAAPRPGEAWKAKEYDIRLKRNTKAAEGVMGQVVQDVQDAIEPLQRTTLGTRRRRQPLRPQAPKCYPPKARSYLLSLGNVLFPFYNPAFAIGIGLVYWLVTWQFQSLVSQHGISSGKIDTIGLQTPFASVLPFMPLYLIQAMIASISLTAMLAGLYATLIWYVDAVDRPGFRRYATKFIVGSAHFFAHLIAMFTLSLFVVMLNNWMTPSIERQLDALYQARKEQAPIIRDVIEESLEPLQRQARQRERAPSAPEVPKPTPVREIVGFTSYPTLMVLLGALIGGSLWGLYWVVTGLFARMHAEEAFAALRIKNYKNFLRLKFEPDKLTIYPLGIDKVPGPDHWMDAPRGKANPQPNNPKLIAVKPIDVRLIENPIVIPCYDETCE
ncbi:MAG: hypothetical protein F9K29_16265 [Hyphomicrobiaceae bacterium]|nr:MAG: hypothetical protein F9K29_16265 [Hyphomicrobiaceae bacterium]